MRRILRVDGGRSKSDRKGCFSPDAHIESLLGIYTEVLNESSADRSRGRKRYVTHNAGLAYLSSALLARQHEVRVLDMNNYDFTNAEVAAYAKHYKPDWIGASVKTALVSSAEKTMRAIHAAWPHARTMVGGAHIGVTGAGYMSRQDVYEFGLTGEGACHSGPD